MQKLMVRALFQICVHNLVVCAYCESFYKIWSTNFDKLITFLACTVKHCIGQGWYNVVLYPMKQLQLLLIAGCPSATDDRCFVWPMSTNDSASPSHIHSVTDAIKTVCSTARFV